MSRAFVSLEVVPQNHREFVNRNPLSQRIRNRFEVKFLGRWIVKELLVEIHELCRVELGRVPFALKQAPELLGFVFEHVR